MRRIWMKRCFALVFVGLLGLMPGLLRAEVAVYNTTYRAPRCTSSIGPCNIPTELIESRDNSTNQAEPNQPNTVNTSACADGTGGTFHGNKGQSIGYMVLSAPEGGSFEAGDTVQLQVNFYVRDTTQDEIDVFRAPNVASPVWTLIKNERGGWVYQGSHRRTYSFKLANAVGDQVIRAQISRNGNSNPCEGTSRSA